MHINLFGSVRYMYAILPAIKCMEWCLARSAINCVVGPGIGSLAAVIYIGSHKHVKYSH